MWRWPEKQQLFTSTGFSQPMIRGSPPRPRLYVQLRGFCLGLMSVCRLFSHENTSESSGTQVNWDFVLQENMLATSCCFVRNKHRKGRFLSTNSHGFCRKKRLTLLQIYAFLFSLSVHFGRRRHHFANLCWVRRPHETQDMLAPSVLGWHS